MAIIDISLPLDADTPTYKGNAKRRPKIERTRTLSEGANESRITLDAHTGTHVDAPFHMVEGGKTIDLFSLWYFHGLAEVVEVRGVEAVEESHLLPFKNRFSEAEFILIRTDNSYTDRNREDFIYLSQSGAEFLAQQGIKGVGIDSLGIERNQPGHPTHRALLGRDILVFEGLALEHAMPGRYFFRAYPLLIREGDGSPVRAFLESITP